MPEKTNTAEANKVLKLLVQAIYDAHEINKNSNNEKAKREITNFLMKIEEEATSFFRENIDRRKEVRNKPIIQDITEFYGIKWWY